MARQIDLDQLLKYPLRRESALCDEEHADPHFLNGVESILEWAQTLPTLTPPNEPLTLISISDELPPDNERVLVYRPCMVDSDIGPYSVQWGWAAKRDGSHWARLPDRRPPEGEV